MPVKNATKTPNKGGRPKGSRNRATLEIKEFCRGLFKRKRYQARLRKQWDAGELPAEVEKLLLYYAFGKPATAIDLNVAGFDPAAYLSRNNGD